MTTSSLATDLAEADLARRVFGSYETQPLLWRELDLPGAARLCFQVETCAIVKECGPGDIDALVCDALRPERGIAFECKRVKVKPEAFSTGLPGKLGGLRKGAEQANRLRATGFHRAYLLIFVVVDGRERPGPSFIDRGLTGGLARMIDCAPGLRMLHPDVGLVMVELSQPTDRSITEAGGAGVRVVRDAARAAQSAEVTRGIVAYLGELKSFS